ncbi:hypothetical protein J6590_087386 [Homalodisca vitripennis]|nr:hypothetical protein J6590_087386 [Homalodisca vitripennis]
MEVPMRSTKGKSLYLRGLTEREITVDNIENSVTTLREGKVLRSIPLSTVLVFRPVNTLDKLHNSHSPNANMTNSKHMNMDVAH